MSPENPVVRITIRGRTYPHRNRLKAGGFRWDPERREWSRTVPKADVPSVLRSYGIRGLRLFTDEPEYRRDPGVHHRFVTAHAGQKLRCVYCGRRLYPGNRGRDQLTVDHVIPVDAVNGSFRCAKYRERMRRAGIQTINDPRNLVPACPRCNRRKGTRFRRIWRLRAKIGTRLFGPRTR